MKSPCWWSSRYIRRANMQLIFLDRAKSNFHGLRHHLQSTFWVSSTRIPRSKIKINKPPPELILRNAEEQVVEEAQTRWQNVYLIPPDLYMMKNDLMLPRWPWYEYSKDIMPERIISLCKYSYVKYYQYW